MDNYRREQGGGGGRKVVLRSSVMSMQPGTTNPYDQFRGDVDNALPSNSIDMGKLVNHTYI